MPAMRHRATDVAIVAVAGAGVGPQMPPRPYPPPKRKTSAMPQRPEATICTPIGRPTRRTMSDRPAQVARHKPPGGAPPEPSRRRYQKGGPTDRHPPFQQMPQKARVRRPAMSSSPLSARLRRRGMVLRRRATGTRPLRCRRNPRWSRPRRPKPPQSKVLSPPADNETRGGGPLVEDVVIEIPSPPMEAWATTGSPTLRNPRRSGTRAQPPMTQHRR